MPQTEQQQPETAAPFAAPQISLPKGGGAIRGLGEKFQTNPANGTAALTIPVPLSKSRGEFQPALTLSYSSGSGNGAGCDFAGCKLLRVTTAAKLTALPTALGIGFYSAMGTVPPFSANIGRLLPTGALKRIGEAELKNGQAAVLHEFAALVKSEKTAGVGKILKPYMEFKSGISGVVFRNWDPAPGNYAVGGENVVVDRARQVLR